MEIVCIFSILYNKCLLSFSAKMRHIKQQIALDKTTNAIEAETSNMYSLTLFSEKPVFYSICFETGCWNTSSKLV